MNILTNSLIDQFLDQDNLVPSEDDGSNDITVNGWRQVAPPSFQWNSGSIQFQEMYLLNNPVKHSRPFKLCMRQ